MKRSDTIILPVGAIEVYGLHCPLGSDLIVASHVAKQLGERTKNLVGPSIPVGDSAFGMTFPGTLTVRLMVLKEYVRDICESLVHHGIRRILFLNTHLGNVAILTSPARSMKH